MDYQATDSRFIRQQPQEETPVSLTPETIHLNGHHRETMSQIFQHPVSHNIEWRAVLSLLDAVASVEETHRGNFLVTLGAETETFEPPKHKDINAQVIVDLRRMLRNAGFQPDGEDSLPTEMPSPDTA